MENFTEEEQLVIDMNERRELFKALLELGGVHVGSTAFTKIDTDSKIDLDIAITSEMMTDYSSTAGRFDVMRLLHANAPTRYEGASVEYTAIRGEVLKCDYQSNPDTLWTAVNKVIWKSGISMDILFYGGAELEAVRTVMPMLLINREIWRRDRKETRVRLFETLVKKVFELEKNYFNDLLEKTFQFGFTDEVELIDTQTKRWLELIVKGS